MSEQHIKPEAISPPSDGQSNLGDSLQGILSVEQQKADHERAKIDQLDAKYPEAERHHVGAILGVEVVVCGGEPNPEHIRILEQGMQTLEKRFGREIIEKAFSSVTAYLVADASVVGGGQALPREDAVILSSEHMGMLVGDMEELASSRGMYRKGDQSEVFGADSDASEIGFVHELGHILEYRAHGDMGLGFARLDHDSAPTWYGQAKGAHEDYAESWMFLAYGHAINGSREAILRDDLDLVASQKHD